MRVWGLGFLEHGVYCSLTEQAIMDQINLETFCKRQFIVNCDMK